MTQTPSLTNWKIVDVQGVYYLEGYFFDEDLRFGYKGSTGPLESIDFVTKIAVTKNTTYRLED